MKVITSSLVSLMIGIVLVPWSYSQVCVPSGQPGAPTITPCPLRSKQITYTITWPDQAITYLSGTGTGGCDTTWNCPPNNAPTTWTCDASFSTSQGSGNFMLTVQDTAPNCFDLNCVPAGTQRPCECYNNGSPRFQTSSRTCWPSPILIDLGGDGFDLSDHSTGVPFDISGFGLPEKISWTTSNSDDAWLVLDRNENGKIDDGTELFGNFTEQPNSSFPNGFIALAELDLSTNGGNSNGRVDDGDTMFRSLRLWRDANHDGLSEPSELSTLASARITGIDLDYHISKRTEKHGNKFQYRAKVYVQSQRGGKVGRWAWDVFLVTR